MKFGYLAIVVVAVGITLEVAAIASTQTTNVIPANLFLTDDGHIFWYKPGKRLVDIRKIEAAQKSTESRPADQDPNGHWGLPTNGFQLSLRFEKSAFANGEPIIAVMLMRNITDTDQTYFAPIRIVAMKDGKELKPKNANGYLEITRPPTRTLFPQTQHRYQANLNQTYDLSADGEYTFEAVIHRPEVSSQIVTIKIE